MVEHKAKSKTGYVQNIILILRFAHFGLNALALAGAIFYLITPTPHMLWNTYGNILLAALLGNLISIAVGGTYRYLDYCYLLLSAVSMLLIPILNTLASSNPHNLTSQSVVAIVLFCALFALGAVTAGLRILFRLKKREQNPDDTQVKSRKYKTILRWIAVVVLCLYVPVGIVFSYYLLVASAGHFMEVFISPYAVFWGLLFFGASILVVKLRWRNSRSIFNKIMMGLGILSCVIFMLPLAATPHTTRNANAAFRDAFGDTGAERSEFMRHPFSLQDYFFGVRTGNFTVIENNLFFEGASGVDAGIRLYYDVYMPATDGGDLPGGNAVLIRIHGGAWIMGGKGAQNYAAINKHFAGQGYVVFDIEYGLNNRNDSFAAMMTPHVRGDFDIDDMVRHIGIFTTHLAENAHRYNADLSNVFISGGSAGGQLATAAALGITSGRYTDILDSRLQIRGLIPVYPANGLSPAMGIGGTPDLVDPVLLIDENSPPALVFHGTHDSVVSPEIASIFQETHRERSNAPSAIIWLNFAGHGADFYTPGHFNQVFTYYMERFMYQFRQ